VIANARMYAVSPEAAAAWRALLGTLIVRAGLDVEILEHAEPAPIDALWQRGDLAAVFMCGLPYSRADPKPHLLAAPVAAPAVYQGLPRYWSEWIVRKDSLFERVEDTFGGRLALTAPHSQSGCLAALRDLEKLAGRRSPLYREVIEPRVTPLGAMRAVIDGAADLAPLDSYAFALLERYRNDLTAEVRVIGRTDRKPIPPVVATVSGVEALRSAFLEAHREPATRALLDALLLERFVPAHAADYDDLRTEAETALRYWRTHALAATVHPAFGELGLKAH
jgi:ABC-type phosphate/phosphonate transport system substrate-binding protein